MSNDRNGMGTFFGKELVALAGVISIVIRRYFFNDVFKGLIVSICANIFTRSEFVQFLYIRFFT